VARLAPLFFFCLSFFLSFFTRVEKALDGEQAPFKKKKKKEEARDRIKKII